MGFFSYLRRLGQRGRDARHQAGVDAFTAAVDRLGPGDVAIDCGANVGKYTVPMARTGARIYAFEPHPDAFAELCRNTANLPNVTPIHAAVTAAAGPVRLYMHKRADDDPLHFSTSSSLLSSKSNVSKDRFVEVDGIRLATFINDTAGGNVALLKMDIEGAEVAVLNDLLDQSMHQRIGSAFVEVHDRRVRELVEPTRQLRERLASLGAGHMRLDWR